MVWSCLKDGIDPCSDQGVESPKTKLLLSTCFEGLPTISKQTIASCGTTKLLLDLKDELGMTVLMVEHNMSVVSSIADTITVLQRGALLAEGPYAVVSRNPQVIEAYMGSAQVELAGAH